MPDPEALGRFRDGVLVHGVRMKRAGLNVARRVIALLNESEADLERQIRDRVGWIASRGVGSDFTLRRLEENLKVVRATLRDAYRAAKLEAARGIRELAAHEEEFLASLAVRTGLGAAARLDYARLAAIAVKRPFQGRLLREWGDKLEEDTAAAVRSSIRRGLALGETTDQIVRRIIGSRSKGYADGILEARRGDVESVVLTASSHVENSVREEMYALNTDIFGSVLVWLGTLDSRTCPVCIVRDGKRYDAVTHKPIGHDVPYLDGPGRMHLRDRCTSAPDIEGDPRGMGNRASMNGPVDGRLTYLDWIKTQPAAIQDEVMGVVRARDLRSGRPVESFWKPNGQWLTIQELRAADDLDG